MLGEMAAASLLRFRNNRQQKIGLTARPGVDRNLAAEHIARPVSRVVMPKWTDPGPDSTVSVFGTAGIAWINVVLAADRQRDAISRRHDNATRPDFDIDLIDLTRSWL